LDDEIYEHVISAFPELVENEHEKLIKLDEDWLKSEDGKKRWRAFINASVHTLSHESLTAIPIRVDMRKR